MNTEQERQWFEAEMKMMGFIDHQLYRLGNGRYGNQTVSYCWHIWQARAAQDDKLLEGIAKIKAIAGARDDGCAYQMDANLCDILSIIDDLEGL